MNDSLVVVADRHRTTPMEGMTVEVDPRLPRSVSGRTVYHCDGHGRYLSEAHRHGSPHEFHCLAGSCQVACQAEPDGPVVWRRLGQGETMLVPGQVGHRIWLEPGSVFAAMAPALSWLLTEDDVVSLSGPEWELP